MTKNESATQITILIARIWGCIGRSCAAFFGADECPVLRRDSLLQYMNFAMYPPCIHDKHFCDSVGNSNWRTTIFSRSNRNSLLTQAAYVCCKTSFIWLMVADNAKGNFISIYTWCFADVLGVRICFPTFRWRHDMNLQRLRRSALQEQE